MSQFNMGSFSDEFAKISKVKEVGKAAGKVKDFVLKHKDKAKWPAILAGGYVAGKGIEQGAKDWSLGRKVRKQYESRGG